MALLYSTANTSREGLAQVATPPPMGRFHHPYSFSGYVDDVTESLDKIGFEVVQDEYEVSPDRQSFFGAMEIAPVSGEITSPGYSLLVGLRGSHNQRLPRGLVLGSRVMVCSNLAFSGNIGDLHTKQTKHIGARLPKMINEVVAQIPVLAEKQELKFETYKNYQLTREEADSTLVEIYRQRGLSGAQLGKAVNEYDNPTFEEHAAYGDSAWKLFNAITQSLKPGGATVNHTTIADRTAIADRFLSNVVGLHTT
jgi:hypothetical protein